MICSATKRIVYLDVVKFIAIWLVCIGHSYSIVTMKHSSILYQWIYSFHMPLFMLLCGFFSKHSFEKPFISFLRQKFVQLVLPAISIFLLVLLIKYLFGEPITLYSFLGNFLGIMWFLKTLFFCLIIVYIVKQIGLNDYVVAICSIMIALLTPHGYFLQFNWMLLFFWTGYFLKYYFVRYVRYRLIITLSSLFIFVFLCKHKVPQVLTYSVLFHNPFQLPLQYIAGLTGSLSIIGGAFYLCDLFKEKCKYIDFLAKMGSFTLGIYGIQSIFLQEILVHFFHISYDGLSDNVLDFVVTPCIGLLSTLLCYFLIQILKRNRIFNLLLFGNQY